MRYYFFRAGIFLSVFCFLLLGAFPVSADNIPNQPTGSAATRINFKKYSIGGSGTFNLVLHYPANHPTLPNHNLNFSVITEPSNVNNMFGSSFAFPYLLPGTYSITETVPEGWTKTQDNCGSITVVLNEGTDCYIENTRNLNLQQFIPAPIPTITIMTPTTAQPGETFQFTINGTGFTQNTIIGGIPALLVGQPQITATQYRATATVFNDAQPGSVWSIYLTNTANDLSNSVVFTVGGNNSTPSAPFVDPSTIASFSASLVGSLFIRRFFI